MSRVCRSNPTIKWERLEEEQDYNVMLHTLVYVNFCEGGYVFR